MALSAVFLAVVITSSLITRNEWVALERSVSEIVAVLTPTQANLVYLVYGVAILALPFVILVSLVVARQWKLLGAYAAAAAIAGLALSITNAGIAAPQWHFDLSDRLDTLPSNSSTTRAGSRCSPRCSPSRGPGCPRGGGAGGGGCCWRSCRSISSSAPWSPRGRCSGWPSAGSSAHWWCSSSAPPALDVPLEGAVRAMARRGCVVSALKVVRPSGAGPLILQADL